CDLGKEIDLVELQKTLPSKAGLPNKGDLACMQSCLKNEDNGQAEVCKAALDLGRSTITQYTECIQAPALRCGALCGTLPRVVGSGEQAGTSAAPPSLASRSPQTPPPTERATDEYTPAKCVYWERLADGPW